MQEGPSWYWQEYPTQIQIEYFNIVQEVDAVFCHNECDKRYYEELTKKPVYIMPTFINLTFINNLPKASKQDDIIMIGGNAGNWYNGVSSLLAVKDCEKIKTVCFPTMGRKLENEEILMSVISKKDIRYLPYIGWDKFTSTLSQFKYAIHLMPTPAAGSFHLQCAAVDVPCIGNKAVDTQRICFPDLSIDPYDIKKAKELIEKLTNNKDFYNKVVATARKNREQFSASVCAAQVKKNLKEIINDRGTKRTD